MLNQQIYIYYYHIFQLSFDVVKCHKLYNYYYFSFQSQNKHITPPLYFVLPIGVILFLWNKKRFEKLKN